MKLKTRLIIAISVVLLIGISSLIGSFYAGSVGLYNSTVNLGAQYTQKDQEIITLYDAKYLAFTEKTKIANINKETFIEVSNIIMSNRKDGLNLSWKWVRETQQIPFEEFTVFYKELSAFVTEQYASLFAIEKQKQTIVQNYNVLIKTYPNNLYNYFLNIQPLTYKFGYISDSTKAKFKQ